MATAPLLLLGGLGDPGVGLGTDLIYYWGWISYGDPGVGLGIDLIYYWGWIALGYSHRPGVIPF